jgi:hypothetical protein
MSAEPAKDPSAPSGPTKRGTLRMVGPRTWPATGKHRVVNSCRAGHEEVIEVHSDNELIKAMIAACLVCGGLVNVSTHVGPNGVAIGTIMIPDDRTPPDDPGAAR